MKIAFFGSSLLSAYWNGAATYYRGIVRALAQRGHEIVFYEPDAFDRQQHRDIEQPEWARVVVYPAHRSAALGCAEEAARNADLVVKASGVGVLDDLLESSVLTLRRPGTLVAFWDVDAPATLDRVKQNKSDYFRDLIPQYDVIFTYGGGDGVVEAYEALGARFCEPVYNALDPLTHRRVAADARFHATVSFLGNRLPDREARFDDFFVNAARRARNFRFLLGGSGWEGKDLPDNIRYVGHVYTADHNAFNSTPLTVLNINRDSMASYGFSPPTRVFEAAGAGACILCDAWPGLELFLEPGREVLVVHSGAELAELLPHITTRAARSIGNAAQRRILAAHTYAQRAIQVELALDGVRHRALAF